MFLMTLSLRIPGTPNAARSPSRKVQMLMLLPSPTDGKQIVAQWTWHMHTADSLYPQLYGTAIKTAVTQ
jgi:hypothetical protein